MAADGTEVEVVPVAREGRVADPIAKGAAEAQAA